MKISLLLCATLAASSCTVALVSDELSIRHDNSFTGRGNVKETLLELRVAPTVQPKAVKLAVSAEACDVSHIRLFANGEECDSRAFRKSGTLKLSCPPSEDTLTLTVTADIRPDATEGNLVEAHLEGLSVKGGFAPVRDTASCTREILLARKRLFAPGDYGSKNYRIPAICTLPDGTLLAATDKRKFNEIDLPSDIDIIVSRSTDRGRSWSEPQTLIEGQGYGKGYGDAALAVSSKGKVVAAFVGGPGLRRSTLENPLRSLICVSDDGGVNWSEPQDVTEMIWGPKAANAACRKGSAAFFESGHGLVLTHGEHAGRIMFVTAVLVDRRLDNYAVYSDDEGETWHISSLAYTDGDESKVVQLPDGRILMSVRRQGERGWSISEDDGESWTAQGTWPDIVANACDGDIILLEGGTLLQSVPGSLERELVTIYMSSDQGKTWPEHKRICGYESVYSSMTVLDDGTIGVYLEENPTGYCEMWYMNFSTEWLKSE